MGQDNFDEADTTLHESSLGYELDLRIQTECWVVVYAKISTDKDNGIKLQGTYFGGQAISFTLAENLARECVNSIKGGTIIPKIFKLDTENDLVEIMYTATEKFEKEVERMIEADRIIAKGQEKRK